MTSILELLGQRAKDYASYIHERWGYRHAACLKDSIAAKVDPKNFTPQLLPPLEIWS